MKTQKHAEGLISLSKPFESKPFENDEHIFFKMGKDMFDSLPFFIMQNM